jgi:hypothetical protein
MNHDNNGGVDVYMFLMVSSVGCKVIYISELHPNTFHLWKNHFGILHYFSPDLEVKLLLSRSEVHGHLFSASC